MKNEQPKAETTSSLTGRSAFSVVLSLFCVPVSAVLRCHRCRDRETSPWPRACARTAASAWKSSRRTWAWDPLRRVILVSADDLKAKGAIYCAAVLAHEVGHYSSRAGPVRPFAPGGPGQPLNAIEDPRVNTWIHRRYPGTGRWLRRLAEADGRTPMPPGLPRLPRLLPGMRSRGAARLGPAAESALQRRSVAALPHTGRRASTTPPPFPAAVCGPRPATAT